MPSIPRHLATGLVLLALSPALLPPRATQAQSEAPTKKLIGAGVAMAIPTYWIGVVAHEGSHALAGTLLGADVTQFSVVPGRYGPRKTFYFGYVRVAGLRSTAARSVFWLAPKITDLLLLSGYTALTMSNNLPSNRYAALALTVVASGLTIDFGKDVLSTRVGNDVVKTYNANNLHRERDRFPWRLLHASITLASGYVVLRGYRKVFETRRATLDSTVIPLWSTPL